MPNTLGLRSNLYLMFAPVTDKESWDIEQRLKKRFPKLTIYREGNATIFTDSHQVWVKQYRKTLRELYTEIYLNFYGLFKGRKQKWQNFVVIFDDPGDYAEYSLTDSVPFWIARGYFSPTDKTLYLYNGFGKKIEGWVFEVIIGKFGGSFDEFVSLVKQKYGELSGEGSRKDIFIDGYMKKYKDKYWSAYAFYKRVLTEETFSVLRHEFTHEILHDWGLQNIILSKPGVDKNEIEKKKKEYLESGDWNKKKGLLEELMDINKKEFKEIKMEAAQSWLAEGMATYCETDPMGSVSDEWLYMYQDMAAKNELSPIEFITNFRMGSFRGLCAKGALGSYAQSWAFTSFLVNRHPEQFMAFQNKMASSHPAGDEDEFDWLLQALGKDLPSVEKEFRDYMKTYPAVEDPRINEYIEYDNIWTKD